ncbi:kinase-like protein [Russula emetica]|nr:kinase-like protein [Russula emetica]
MPQRHAFKALNTTFIVDSDYQFVKELGEGAFGWVVAAKHSRTGEDCAIRKIMNISTTEDWLPRILTKRCLHEIKLLHHLNHFRRHNNIICLYDMDIVFGPDGNFDEVYIYEELMQFNLRDIIRSRAGSPLSDAQAKYLIYQTLCGLKYIHSADEMYYDLKPADMLVSADSKLKICYFRLAHGFSQAQNQGFMTEKVEEWWYRAPERFFLANDSFAIDVWSVGCILAEMLAGMPIFRGRDRIELMEQILCALGTPSEDTLRRLALPPGPVQIYIRSLSIGPRVPFTQMFPPRTNPLAIDLLAKMLTFDPAERITCEQALEHPYLAVWHNPTDEPVCPTKFDTSFLKDDSIEGMKKLIVEEVDAFRSEVRADSEVRSNQSRQCVLGNDIVASPIRDGAPIDGATSGHYSGQTLQDGDDRSKFHEELPDLLNEIEGILGDGDNHKIDDLLERLTVGNTSVNT